MCSHFQVVGSNLIIFDFLHSISLSWSIFFPFCWILDPEFYSNKQVFRLQNEKKTECWLEIRKPRFLFSARDDCRQICWAPGIVLRILYPLPHFLHVQISKVTIILYQPSDWLLWRHGFAFPLVTLQKVKVVIINVCPLNMRSLNQKTVCWARWTCCWPTTWILLLPSSPPVFSSPCFRPLWLVRLFLIMTLLTPNAQRLVQHHFSSCVLQFGSALTLSTWTGVSDPTS